jgi:hypothetical protein
MQRLSLEHNDHGGQPLRSSQDSRPWEHVGDDLDEAIAARERKQAYFEALNANVPVVQDQDETGRTKITDAVYQWFAELQLFQGKDQQGKSEKTLRAYNYRLGFFLDFTAQNNLRSGAALYLTF